MRGFLLFDIDGVIRDVAGSYRRAIQETVKHFTNWAPGNEVIDALKAEGCWNNDWDASLELITRNKKTTQPSSNIPPREDLIKIFNSFYFGVGSDIEAQEWTGLIRNEPLLVDKSFFKELSDNNFGWGFLSGSERPSAKFALEARLGLKTPPLIAMGDAPEKPNPEGLIRLATQIAGCSLGSKLPPIAYLGDTVADVLTIQNARKAVPTQTFISFAIAPPHLHITENETARKVYENQLKRAGADEILNLTSEAIKYAMAW